MSMSGMANYVRNAVPIVPKNGLEKPNKINTVNVIGTDEVRNRTESPQVRGGWKVEGDFWDSARVSLRWETRRNHRRSKRWSIRANCLLWLSNRSLFLDGNCTATKNSRCQGSLRSHSSKEKHKWIRQHRRLFRVGLERVRSYLERKA
jgi:hypothetical protein